MWAPVENSDVSLTWDKLVLFSLWRTRIEVYMIRGDGIKEFNELQKYSIKEQSSFL